MHQYPFVANLGGCNGICNTLDDLSSRIWTPNKTEDVNLNVFNMITRINESKAIPKHISCDCRCKFDGGKCNSNQKWNNDKCWCQCKNPANIAYAKKIIFRILVLLLVRLINIYVY